MAKKGIPQIKIPVRQKDLTIELVKSYLPTVFSKFQANAKIIEDCYD